MISPFTLSNPEDTETKPMTTDVKSSFMRRTISKEDAIIQLLRPQIGSRMNQSLEVLSRMVVEAETLTKLGVKLQPGHNNGENFFVTPADLEANLAEWGELVRFATEGRAFLDGLGYVAQRKVSPITGEGTAPVGKAVDVQPIAVTLPGSEPTTGMVIKPKA